MVREVVKEQTTKRLKVYSNNIGSKIYLQSTGELAMVVVYHRGSDTEYNNRYLKKMIRAVESYVKEVEE